MSDETKKSTKKEKELSLEEKVEAELRKEYEVNEIKVLTEKKRRELQNEKNAILVRKAFEGGLTSAPEIAGAIGMSENGVRRYAQQLGLTLTVTQEERRRQQQDAIRALNEEAEKARYGIGSGNN